MAVPMPRRASAGCTKNARIFAASDRGSSRPLSRLGFWSPPNSVRRPRELTAALHDHEGPVAHELRIDAECALQRALDLRLGVAVPRELPRRERDQLPDGAHIGEIRKSQVTAGGQHRSRCNPIMMARRSRGKRGRL